MSAPRPGGGLTNVSRSLPDSVGAKVALDAAEILKAGRPKKAE
jgi:hypothetical protein